MAAMTNELPFDQVTIGNADVQYDPQPVKHGGLYTRVSGAEGFPVPAEGDLVTVPITGGGTAMYKVINVEQPSQGVWEWTLVPVSE